MVVPSRPNQGPYYLETNGSQSITDFRALYKLRSDLEVTNTQKANLSHELQESIKSNYRTIKLDQLRHTQDPYEKYKFPASITSLEDKHTYLKYLYCLHYQGGTQNYSLGEDLSLEQWSNADDFREGSAYSKVVDNQLDPDKIGQMKTYIATNKPDTSSDSFITLDSGDTTGDTDFNNGDCETELIKLLETEAVTQNELVRIPNKGMALLAKMLFEPSMLAYLAFRKTDDNAYELINFQEQDKPQVYRIDGSNTGKSWTSIDTSKLYKPLDDKDLQGKVSTIKEHYDAHRDTVKANVETVNPQPTLEQIENTDDSTVLVPSTHQQTQEETDAQSAKRPKLSAAQIKERIEILKKRGQKSMLISTLEFLGMLDRQKIYYILASDSSVPTTKLSVGAFAIFSAVLTRAKHIVTFNKDYARFEQGEQVADHKVAAPNTQTIETVETITATQQPTNRKQTEVHNDKQHKFTIAAGLNIPASNALYVAENSTITTGKDEIDKLKLLNAATNGNKLKKDIDYTVTIQDSLATITLKQRAILTNQTIPPATSIFGQATYARIKHLENYNFKK